MSKKMFMAIALSSLMMTGVVHAAAGDHTVTLGYAQTDLGDFKFTNGWDYYNTDKNLKGINVKYRYEFTDTWGIIASGTYSAIKYELQGGSSNGANLTLNYGSVLAGPSVRFTDWLSAYAIIGMAGYEYEYEHGGKTSDDARDFAYGIGLQANISGFTVDASYERSKFGYEDSSDNIKTGTWVLGVGYKF